MKKYRAITRTPETYRKYLQTKSEPGYFVHDFPEVIQEFEYWRIVKNQFPYDNIFEIGHMLVSKRTFSDLSDANEAELAEYWKIREKLVEDNLYHAMLENLPNSRSKPDHCHIHLLTWKMIEDDIS